jgi:hypothetical protein
MIMILVVELSLDMIPKLGFVSNSDEWNTNEKLKPLNADVESKSIDYEVNRNQNVFFPKMQ